MQAADRIMAAANKQGAKIATADLYSFVLGKCGGAGYKTCDGFQLPMNVHYTGDTNRLQTALLAWVGFDTVRAVSQRRDGRPSRQRCTESSRHSETYSYNERHTMMDTRSTA